MRDPVSPVTQCTNLLTGTSVKQQTEDCPGERMFETQEWKSTRNNPLAVERCFVFARQLDVGYIYIFFYSTEVYKL